MQQGNAQWMRWGAEGSAAMHVQGGVVSRGGAGGAAVIGGVDANAYLCMVFVITGCGTLRC